MATPAQHTCFKNIYEREIARYERLIDRGKLYLSIITLYLGLLAVAADEVTPEIADHWIITGAYLASFILFIFALALVINAIGIRTYVYPTDPIKVIKELGAHPPTDSEFFDKRIADYAAAFEKNHPVNDGRAKLLKYASFFMLAGIFCQVIVLSSLVIL